ncbi:MAG: peptidylprolyl isomerase [bacterium]|nr:peptidylprolyl isomerase [bacterium]
MALAIVSLLAGCGGTANEDDSSDSASAEKAQVEGSDISPEEEIQYFGNETVVVLKTNQGNIFVRFFAEISPEHTKNFISHSESGLYAGTLFHRVIPGFMIQGGDPNSKDENPNNDGMGGYSYLGEGKMLNEEFNDIPHTRGILSMARSQDVNSAGSQFFIMHAAYPSLNGKYTVFGEVIDGIEVVDFIANAPKNRRDRPDEDQRIEEVLVEEWSVAKVEATKKAMMEEDSAVHGQ